MPKSVSQKTPSVVSSAPSNGADALAAVDAELKALDPSALVAINLDIPQAVSLVLGALPGIRLLRPVFLQELPIWPINYLDKLDTYALAVWSAHLLAQPGGTGDDPVRVLIEEATPLRANLLSDAEALAQRGLLDTATVAEIRSGTGYVDTANDLGALSALLTANWSTVGGKTAATADEVKRAGELGPMLLAAIGARGLGVAPGGPDAADRRQRAFTLFTRAYGQVRRALTYLRWQEGDADVLAPSLFKGRARPVGSTAANDTPAPAAVTTPATPAPANGTAPSATPTATPAAPAVPPPRTA